MILEEKIAELLKEAKVTWTLTGSTGDTNAHQPEEDDILIMLEALASKLTEEGQSITTGGIIMEKRHGYHDVYVYVGSYV